MEGTKMSVLNRIQLFLDENDVKYSTIVHSPAYTAQEIAASSFISGKEFAKSVILSIDGDIIMAVLPASKKINFPALKKYFDNENIFLAAESEFHNIFSECKTGAMPPFGNLYNVKTYIAKEFEKNKLISFNAGNHQEIIRMKYSCFKNLVKPEVIDLSIN